MILYLDYLLSELIYCNSVNEACKDVDAVILATEWDEFRNINFNEI